MHTFHLMFRFKFEPQKVCIAILRHFFLFVESIDCAPLDGSGWKELTTNSSSNGKISILQQLLL